MIAEPPFFCILLYALLVLPKELKTVSIICSSISFTGTKELEHSAKKQFESERQVQNDVKGIIHYKNLCTPANTITSISISFGVNNYHKKIVTIIESQSFCDLTSMPSPKFCALFFCTHIYACIRSL